MRVTRLIVIGTFLTAFVGAVVFWIIGAIYFSVILPHAPLTPDPVHGFIYPHNNHGVIHYFTHFDHILDEAADILAFTCIPFLIVGGVFAMAYQVGKDRHSPK